MSNTMIVIFGTFGGGNLIIGLAVAIAAVLSTPKKIKEAVICGGLGVWLMMTGAAILVSVYN